MFEHCTEIVHLVEFLQSVLQLADQQLVVSLLHLQLMHALAQLLQVIARLRRAHQALMLILFSKHVCQVMRTIGQKSLLELIDVGHGGHRQLKQNSMSKRNHIRNHSPSNSFSSIDSDLLDDCRRPSRSRSRRTSMDHSPLSNARRLIIQKNSLLEQSKLLQIQVMQLKTQLNQLTSELQENNKQRRKLQQQLQQRQSNLRRKEGQIIECSNKFQRDKQELESCHRLIKQLNERLKHLEKTCQVNEQRVRQAELKQAESTLQANKMGEAKRTAQKQLKLFKAQAQSKIQALQSRITDIIKKEQQHSILHRRSQYSSERPKKLSVDQRKGAGQSDPLRWLYRLGSPQQAQLICRSLVKFSESFVDMVEKLSGGRLSHEECFSKRLSKSWKYLKQFLVQRL